MFSVLSQFVFKSATESGCGLPAEYSSRISSAFSDRLNKQNSSIAPLKFRMSAGSFSGNPLAFQLPNSAAPMRNGGVIFYAFSQTDTPLT